MTKVETEEQCCSLCEHSRDSAWSSVVWTQSAMCSHVLYAVMLMTTSVHAGPLYQHLTGGNEIARPPYLKDKQCHLMQSGLVDLSSRLFDSGVALRATRLPGATPSIPHVNWRVQTSSSMTLWTGLTTLA
eukprot:Blabericola_migrator_1__6864@NODE_3477_length_1738_cov_21_566128_g2162_i0_p2_GENE_NODE_3477_length_1738_cov_21_566128_g2162_i0NODE_3477_length_1738_cov_21_566128_g2162_i0_p2_ORF_typecomplete_len130_score14_42PAN_1/PF00024_26/0_016PAN_4/PF14295_6/0_093PAN_4/PF14295_6/5_4e03_NODE_3477_length_1738_cov_21_566128_g2162_i069458